MGIVETLVELGDTSLWLASLVAAGTGYWLFYRYRDAVATAAGVGAGLVAGMTVGTGVPVVAGGLGGALLGLFGARTHPRGGSVVVGVATGLAFGPVVAVVSTGTIAPAASLAGGAVIGLALAGLAWRFPRAVVVLGTAGLASVLNFAVSLGLGPSVDAVLNGTLIGASTFGGEVNSSVYFAPFVSLVLGATMVQPTLIEYSESAPPLYPAWVRQFFEFDEEFGETPERTAPTCPDCGALGDPGHDACHACGVTDRAAEYGVPSDAVAVDVPCPHCGERPVEETATARTVTGFLLAYRLRSEQIVGCHRCVRRDLWSAARKTALTGWWSVTCILINPLVILWNLGRGALNRGPTLPLAAALNESGVAFEYVDDVADFDPDASNGDEVLVRGLIQLGCAVMFADGTATRDESESIRDAVLELSDEYAREEVQSLIEQMARDRPALDDVLEGLAGILTVEGRETALALAADVATADGQVCESERAMLEEISDAFDLEEPAAAPTA